MNSMSNAFGYPNLGSNAEGAIGYSDPWQSLGVMSENTSLSSGPGIALGSATLLGGVVWVDDSAFFPVNLSSSTVNPGTSKVENRPLASPSYTFVTSSDQYTKIFSAQCDRINNYIFGQLERVDRADDDQNENIVDGIAAVIGLVGEPAAYTAMFEADLLRDEPTILEPLLLAIGSAHHKETEADRVGALRRYANDRNYRVQRAAVRALGRMNTPAARDALRAISNCNQAGEIGRFAAALLR